MPFMNTKKYALIWLTTLSLALPLGAAAQDAGLRQGVELVPHLAQQEATQAELEGAVSAPEPPLPVPPDTFEQAPLTYRANGDYEDQVIELVNQQRWNNGQLPPLKLNVLLRDTAYGHSSRMGTHNFFSHCDLDSGATLSTRISASGYPALLAGENIGAGYTTPQAAVNGWMASSGHRANILSTGFREIGVGYYYDAADTSNVRYDLDGNCIAESSSNGPFRHYWTQNFGQSFTYPVVINREAFSTTIRNVDLYLYGSGWATQMRIKNVGESFTPWMTFDPNVNWQLSQGGGTKTVTVEIRNGSGTVRSATDTIFYDAPSSNLGFVFGDGFESGSIAAWDGSS